jgi:hypothetical protein
MQNKPEQDRNQEATVYLVSSGFLRSSCCTSASPLVIHDMLSMRSVQENNADMSVGESG